jgi:hypothetical protein
MNKEDRKTITDAVAEAMAETNAHLGRIALALEAVEKFLTKWFKP